MIPKGPFYLQIDCPECNSMIDHEIHFLKWIKGNSTKEEGKIQFYAICTNCRRYAVEGNEKGECDITIMEMSVEDWLSVIPPKEACISN